VREVPIWNQNTPILRCNRWDRTETPLSIVKRAMKPHGVPENDIKAFMEEATSGNYDHLLQTCIRSVEVQ
jgi:predicted ATP-dependent Lon-type protease